MILNLGMSGITSRATELACGDPFLFLKLTCLHGFFEDLSTILNSFAGFLLFYFILYPNKFVLTDGSVYKFKLEFINIPSYYKWSEYGEMSVDSIYETAELGEKLYVVHIGRKRNVMCYNARMFEPYGFTVEDSHADRQQDGENSPE